MSTDFKKLSPEQDKILREILATCHYLQVLSAWKPPVSDDVLAQQARELGRKFAQLEKLSNKGTPDGFRGNPAHIALAVQAFAGSEPEERW